MKPAAELLASFDQSWEKFSGSWKEAHRKPSEKSVHALRVSGRRLLAVIELLRAVSKDSDVSSLRRSIKELLKDVGPLRDVQVQLRGLSELPQTPSLERFEKTLERREDRKIADIDKTLKRRRRRGLKAAAKAAREVASDQPRKRREDALAGVRGVIQKRRSEFSAAKRKLKTSDEEALHRLRLALKKLRYAKEASELISGETTGNNVRQLEKLQRTLGELRDIQLLMRSLNAWAIKHGEEVDVASALTLLQKKQSGLERTIPRMTKALSHSSGNPRRPATERTVAVAPSRSKPVTQAGIRGRVSN